MFIFVGDFLLAFFGRRYTHCCGIFRFVSECVCVCMCVSMCACVCVCVSVSSNKKERLN